MIFRSIITFILGLLPTFTIAPEVVAGVTQAFSWVGVLNHYIPIDTFLFCLGVYFGTWFLCALVSAVLQLF